MRWVTTALALLGLASCADPAVGAEAQRRVAAGAVLLDVRTPGEFSRGHVEGAINIPVHELSARRDEVPRGDGVVVYCQSGQRSAIAARQLEADGYEVYDLGSLSAWPD